MKSSLSIGGNNMCAGLLYEDTTNLERPENEMIDS